jgi:hypothetical protein
MQTPRTVTITAKNTGNVVTIPRGIVTIRDPRGVVIAQGAVNTASAAIAPGNELKLQVPITVIGQATRPGTYRIGVTYGFGGDSKEATTTKTFVFIAWWHAAITAAALVVIVSIASNFRRTVRYVQAHRKKPEPLAAPPAKRRILIGRNA